jgi:arsenate reductase
MSTAGDGAKGASVTIYHNPSCGASRNALAAIRARGVEPTVVEYLKVGWTRPLLERLLKTMKQPPRAILRVRGTPAEALGLTDPKASDDKILSAMLAHPILVERPIVVTPKGAVLCRPLERLQALLDG